MKAEIQEEIQRYREDFDRSLEEINDYAKAFYVSDDASELVTNSMFFDDFDQFKYFLKEDSKHYFATVDRLAEYVDNDEVKRILYGCYARIADFALRAGLYYNCSDEGTSIRDLLSEAKQLLPKSGRAKQQPGIDARRANIENAIRSMNCKFAASIAFAKLAQPVIEEKTGIVLEPSTIKSSYLLKMKQRAKVHPKQLDP